MRINAYEDSECSSVYSNSTIMAVYEDPIDEMIMYGIRPMSAITKMWNCTNAEIGIIGLQMAHESWGYSIYYEIFLSFPDVHKEWTVRRTYQEFCDLHKQLYKAFYRKLDQRRIVLPRPSRFEFYFSQEERYIQSARRLRSQLNLYLHRLLEITDVHTSPLFRSFFDFRDSDLESRTSLQHIDIEDSYISPTDSSMSVDEAVAVQSVDSSEESPKHQHRELPKAARHLPSYQDFDWHAAPASAELTLESSANDLHMVTTLRQQEDPTYILPIDAHVMKTTSNCTAVLLFGNSISLRTCGGLCIGLTKRSAWSGSERVAAVGAVAAGITFLSGPIGLTLGALGSIGKHQLSKTYSLSTAKKKLVKYDEFIIEVAEMFSSPARPVHYGDTFRLLNVGRNQYVRLAVPSDSRRAYLTVSSDKGTQFRFVSPLGYVGPIVCGSPVCMQVADHKSRWIDDFVSVHNDFVTTDGPLGVFQIGVFEHPCMANEDISKTIARSYPRPVDVSVAVYNVWFLPAIATSLFNVSPFKARRAHGIPAALNKAVDRLPDAVVFCEAFDSDARELLIAEMKRIGYLYETRIAGQMRGIKILSSGVFGMSRFPIEHYDELLFGSASMGDDKAADKGAIYFQMKKGGEVIHVVGTHLQAWESEGAIASRKVQLNMIKDWIKAKKISPRDIVIYAGDFNIDKLLDEPTEFNDMIKILNAMDPQLSSESLPYSFDPETNILASKGVSSGGRKERLDYVMCSNGHRKPHSARSAVLPLKAEDGFLDRNYFDGKMEVFDLSDHYPVLSEYKFR